VAGVSGEGSPCETITWVGLCGAVARPGVLGCQSRPVVGGGVPVRAAWSRAWADQDTSSAPCWNSSAC